MDQLMPEEPADGEIAASIAQALEQLADGKEDVEMLGGVSQVAAAIYIEVDGQADRLRSVAQRLRQVESIDSLAVQQTGMCVRECPPNSPAPYRVYSDEDGGETRVCDHVPIHQW